MTPQGAAPMDLGRDAPLAVTFAIAFAAITWTLITALDTVFGLLISGYVRHGQAHYEALGVAVAAGFIGVRAHIAPPAPLRQFAIGAFVGFLPAVFVVSALSMWDLAPPPALEAEVREACAQSVHTSLCGPAFGIITYAKVVRAAPALVAVTPLLWWAARQAHHTFGRREP